MDELPLTDDCSADDLDAGPRCEPQFTRILVFLCLFSFVAYLFNSLAVRSFVSEFLRLTNKFVM